MRFQKSFQGKTRPAYPRRHCAPQTKPLNLPVEAALERGCPSEQKGQGGFVAPEGTDGGQSAGDTHCSHQNRTCYTFRVKISLIF